MQAMLDLCNKYHKATGGHIQEGKLSFFLQMWEWKQGKKQTKNVEVELLMNNKQLAQMCTNQDTKSLGVQMGPSLQWIAQYNMLEEKLQKAMWKVKIAPVTVSNACVFYNVCLLTHVCYGWRIVKITPKQKL